MIDTRAVVQEVQDQLLAAAHRGQDQMRRSQEQMRKSREAVADVIRSGNQLAKAVRPSIPTLPRPTVHIPSLSTLRDPAKLRELTDHVIATQRSLTDKAVQAASPVADQVIARQRKLADQVVTRQRERADQIIARQRDIAGKAFHVASPFVTEGVAKLSQVVGTLQDVRRPRHTTEPVQPAVTADEATASAEAAHVDAAPAESVAPEVGAAETTAPETQTSKPRASKPRTPRASSAKTSPARTSPAKAADTGKTAGTSRTRAPKK
jgi:hypothetical protein